MPLVLYIYCTFSLRFFICIIVFSNLGDNKWQQDKYKSRWDRHSLYKDHYRMAIQSDFTLMLIEDEFGLNCFLLRY